MRIRWTNAAAADMQGIMPYVAVYRVRENAIEIVRIRHMAQDRP